MSAQLGDLCQEIVARRNCGHVTCAVLEREHTPANSRLEVAQLLDEFVERFEYKGIGAWDEVSIADAGTIVRAILRADTAYHVALMPDTMASSLAERFLSLFGSAARCFTNGNLIIPTADPKSVPGAFNPIGSVSDTGVVCFDSDRIGILWVEDED